MADAQLDRRLSEAGDLKAAIDGLSKVEPALRSKFVHDCICSAVDAACRDKDGRQIFNSKQADALKAITFALVHVVDIRTDPPQGFFRRAFLDFKQQKPLVKVQMVSAAIVVLVSSGWGVWKGLESFFPSLRASVSVSAQTQKIEQRPGGSINLNSSNKSGVQ